MFIFELKYLKVIRKLEVSYYFEKGGSKSLKKEAANVLKEITNTTCSFS